jgi:HPt (histidine-containing phosphotransfer) domain-containing protein
MDDTTGGNSNDKVKPYDLTMINAISDNNHDFFNKLLLMFYDTVAADMAIAKTAASENKWAEVAQLAHKMKTSLTHFGVYSVKAIIVNLEHYENIPTERLKALVLEMDQIVNDVFFNLKEEFPDTFNNRA